MPSEPTHLLPPFPHQVEFDPAAPTSALAQLPALPAVFALRGTTGEPYLNRTADLRRRVTRLLTPAPAQSKRLQLASLVRSIAWTETASDFTQQLLLYRASIAAFGEEGAKRLHLRAPCFLRMGMRNRFPRAWLTTSITLAAAADLFGPFPSRGTAERYAEQVLDLFLLRRCLPDLDPDPAFPGCIYSEMKKCLAPCYGGCTQQRYDEETSAVHAFFATGGTSLLASLAAERDRSSEALDFESAAAVHARYSKVESVTSTVPELARALSAQHGVLVQPAQPAPQPADQQAHNTDPDADPDQVDLYLLRHGIFTGPVAFSVLGMRLPNEHSGSSSLFAHPATFTPVPLGQPALEAPPPATPKSPEERLSQAMATLETRASEAGSANKRTICDHQSLLSRWYYRPQTKREGELVLAPAASTSAAAPSTVPLKPLLRAIARVYRAHVEKHAPHAAPNVIQRATSETPEPSATQAPEE